MKILFAEYTMDPCKQWKNTETDIGVMRASENNIKINKCFKRLWKVKVLQESLFFSKIARYFPSMKARDFEGLSLKSFQNKHKICQKSLI